METRMLKKHGPRTDWFDAAEGVRLFRGLIEILEREGFRKSIELMPEERGMLKSVPPRLLAELSTAATSLEQATAAGAQFRIETRWNVDVPATLQPN
jgi:hypothetical protein